MKLLFALRASPTATRKKPPASVRGQGEGTSPRTRMRETAIQTIAAYIFTTTQTNRTKFVQTRPDFMQT